MRISLFSIYDGLTRSLQENLSRLYENHESLASGKRINRPSQDVIGAARALDYRVSIGEREQAVRNSDNAVAYLEAAEGVLGDATSALTRTRELALMAMNGVETGESRSATAKEVRELKKHLLSLANNRFRERYLFSGFLTDGNAFDPTTYDYRGDANSIEVKVGTESKVKVTMPGTEAFAYIQSSHEVVAIEDGARYIHYIPGQVIDSTYPRTRVMVAISTSGDAASVEAELQAGPPYTTVEDSFYFDNSLQMMDRLQSAMENNDTDRIGAILKPIDDSIGRVTDARAELGARMNFIEGQKDRMENSLLDLQVLLSRTEDADIAEVISEVSKNEVALQALRNTGARLLSQSLLDFLT